MLTHSHLLECIFYDLRTGNFTLLRDTARRKAGSIINNNSMTPQRSGRPVRYATVSFEGRSYPAGHLAWFYVTGEWPPDEIDHRDTDGWNQRWVNLRPATRSQNQANTGCYASNKYGRKGVYLRDGGAYRAMIQKDGRRISLGSFDTESAAHAAYAAAATQLHGEYARP